MYTGVKELQKDYLEHVALAYGFVCVLYFQSGEGGGAALHLPEEVVPGSVCSGRPALRISGKWQAAHYFL